MNTNNKNIVFLTTRPRDIGIVALYSIILLLITSCTTLKTDCLHYQSVRKTYRYDNSSNNSIVVATLMDYNGNLSVGIKNNTDEIMTINMVKSFVVNTSGKSLSFYDPTIRAESSTTSSSHTNGGSINLGAVASALGIGGVAGVLANGINVGGSNTSGVSNTSTTYLSDMPQVSLAPHSSGAMPKVFNIESIYRKGAINTPYKELSRDEAEKFALIILWSIDDGKTFTKYEQWYYINADFTVPVRVHGHVNDALREIMTKKTDCINEPWWIIYSQNNYYSSWIYNSTTLSVDYQ